MEATNLGTIRLNNEAIQFEGPKTNHCFGTPYVTFAIGGPVKEGSMMEDVQWEGSAKSAHSRFFKELNEYTKDAKQIAWRYYPEFKKTEDGMWTIKCRLAVWNG